MHKPLYAALKKAGVSVSRTWDNDRRYLRVNGRDSAYYILRHKTRIDGSYFYRVENNGVPVKSSSGFAVGSGLIDYFWFARAVLVENYAVNELGEVLPAGTCTYNSDEQKKQG